MKRLISVALLLLICIAPFSALCRTWHVEKDGSGDYSVIQDCVNASSSGDTIFIGEGRYDEWQLYGGNYQYPARIIIDGVDLTIIGNDGGGTTIGPPEVLDGEHHGVALTSGSTLVVKSIHFENLYGGVMSWSGGNVLIENCTFTECNYGTFLDGGGGEVNNCEFSFATNIGRQVMSYYQNSFSARNCKIEKVGDLGDLGFGFDVISCSDATLDHCRISGMRTGAQFYFGTNATIIGCHLLDITGSAILVGFDCNSLYMGDCSIFGSEIGVNVEETTSLLMVESTVFGNVGTATLVGNNFGDGYFRNCVLSRGDNRVVAYKSNLQARESNLETVTEYDMRENYWGTDNPDSIQAWIEDYEDDPDIGYRILWSPFSDEPVSTKSESLGGVKSLFR